MADEDIDLLTARVQLANLESDLRNMLKPRSKSSDTSRMNKVYKPKASPGPIGSSANVREGRSPDRSPKPNRSNVRENRLPKTTPNANTREGRLRDTVKAKPAAKSAAKPTKNLGGFKPGTVGYNAIKSFKKAYQGK